VPTVGGIASISAMLVVGALLAPDALPWPLATGMLGLLVVGSVDDRVHLAPAWRFVAQIVATVLMIGGSGVMLRDFGELLWPGWVLGLGWFAVPVTVFCAVGVHNALNMIDGVDGLAGSLTAIALAGVGVASLMAGRQDLVALAALGLGAVAAFLVFNLRVGARSARVFLGNGGSLAVGFLLAWLFVDGSQGARRAFDPVTALWLFAVPLIDTVSVLWRRLAQGLPPFRADHRHLHHLLLRAGRGPGAIAAWLATGGALLASVGLLAERLGAADAVRFAAFLGLAFAYHAIVRRADATLPPWRGR
jgi:UDP-GlcNAc:undecaprenyl-phosphate/decaprenyl-phosphate GlcNAc-1-phosphate transferase